jgi:hypothetical protein
MSDDKKTSGAPELSALAEELSAEITPAARELAHAAGEKVMARAVAEGWSKSQAEWLVKLALEPLFQAVAKGVSGPDALEEAYRTARRGLAVGYFDNVLSEGKNRYTAFLTVVDLEKQIAERRGEPPADYPDAVLLEACRAVEAAAASGATSDEQIATGYDVIRKMLEQAAH